jgi:DNA replication protein DnaC
VWAAAILNPLITHEQDYDADHQAHLAEQRITLLNQEQWFAFDQIIQAVESQSGQSFFLNGPGGTGKTFVYNTICPSYATLSYS